MIHKLTRPIKKPAIAYDELAWNPSVLRCNPLISICGAERRLFRDSISWGDNDYQFVFTLQYLNYKERKIDWGSNIID